MIESKRSVLFVATLLTVAVDEARTVYYDHFWDLPYPKEVFLQNFFGFTLYGDPGLRYPDVVDGKYAG